MFVIVQVEWCGIHFSELGLITKYTMQLFSSFGHSVGSSRYSVNSFGGQKVFNVVELVEDLKT